MSIKLILLTKKKENNNNNNNNNYYYYNIFNSYYLLDRGKISLYILHIVIYSSLYIYQFNH